MSSEQNKQQQRQTLDQIARDFYTLFPQIKDQALRTGRPEDLAKAFSSQRDLQTRLNRLKEQFWPFESLFSSQELLRQYEDQTEIFKKVGLLQKLSSGANGEERWGINDINGQESPFPSLEEVKQTMKTKENQDVLMFKLKQFDNPQCLIVPRGMKLGFMRPDPDYRNPDNADEKRYLYDGLVGIYAEQLRDHYARKELYYTKAHPNDPFKQEDQIDTTDKFNESQPIWLWDEYNNADVDGTLVYGVKAFSSDPAIHQGRTKQQILKEQGAWQILFTPDMPNIPRRPRDQEEAQKRIKGGRPPLYTSGATIQEYLVEDYLTNEQKQQKQQGQIIIPCLHDYLNALNNSPIYKGEVGFTPEADLTDAILYLNRHKQVINDFGGAGSIPYYLNVYFLVSGFVPYGCFSRDSREVILDRCNPDGRFVYCGVRPAVSLKPLSRQQV